MVTKRKYVESDTIQGCKLNEKAIRFFEGTNFAMDPPEKRVRNAQRQQLARNVELCPEDRRKLNDDKSSTKRHLQLLTVVRHAQQYTCTRCV